MIFSAFAEDICIVRGFDFPIYQEVVDGFWKQMGQSPSKCDQTLKGRESQALSEIKSQSPKIFFALGSSSITFLSKEFPNTPMVFGMASEGGSAAAGVVVDVPFEEQIDLVKQALPSLNRVGLIYSVGNSSTADKFKRSAESKGLTVNSHAINNPSEAVGVVQNLKGDDLLWLLPDQGVITANNRDQLFQEATNQNLKICAFSPTYLKGSNAADLSVSIDWQTYGMQIADLVKKVLENPNKKFPVETPRDARIYFKKGRKGFNINIQNAKFVP